MSARNPFLHEPEHYKRDTDIIPAAKEQAIRYIMTMRGKSYEWAKDFVERKTAPGGEAELKDRDVFFLQRKKNGDREQKEGTLMQYLDFVRKHELIMAPTMTVYLNPKQKPSFLAKYINNNIKKRKVHKKAMFAAKMAGDEAKENFEDNNQSTCKYKNNSLSGAQLSPHNPLFNMSAHSTLTSGCRITTSYANANNEYFIAGNRHYWAPQIVLNHMTTTVLYTNFERLQLAMDTYGLHYPTADELVECVKYSSDLYWRHVEAIKEIAEFAEKMLPIQRAAFVYCGDLYHLAKYNDAVVRKMLGDLAHRSELVITPVEAAEAIINSTEEDVLNMATLLCSEWMAGRQVVDVRKGDHVIYGRLAATCQQIRDTLDHYKPMIQGLWRPEVLTPSVAVIPSMIRRAVVASDTDSTIFTTQHWTRWFTGGELFTPKTYDIGYTITFLTSQIVTNKLAMMSKNLGAIDEHLHTIAMKNEYYFPTFCLTGMAKHYFAYKSAQEGNVLRKLESEVKGVNLRSSTVAPVVMKRAKKYMTDIMDGVMARGKLTLDEILGPIAHVEQIVFNDLQQGGFRFMNTVQVKDTESYAQGDSAPVYQHHLMWQEVFADHYGAAPEIPYNAVRISTDLPTRKHLDRWIQSMPNRELATKMDGWLKANKKTALNTLVFPIDNLQTSGFPKEVHPVVDNRKIAATTMNAFYIVLESVGIYMRNDRNTRLVSDTYAPTHEHNLEC